jgi:hypothetical protein
MGCTELQNATLVKGPRGLGRKTRDRRRRAGRGRGAPGLATALGEETVADAISDRFVYGAHRIKLRDESRLEGFALDGNRCQGPDPNMTDESVEQMGISGAMLDLA